MQRCIKAFPVRIRSGNKKNKNMSQYRNIPDTDKCYSEVAKSGERVFCVTVPELVSCGVSETYMKRGISAQRNGEVYCWPHHKEGNTVYIHYEGLKDKYKALIRSVLMDGKDIAEWYAVNGRLNDIMNRFNPYINAVYNDEDYIENDRFIQDYAFADGSALSAELAKKYRDALVWIAFLSKVRDKKTVLEMGYARAGVFWDDVEFALRSKSISLPKVYTKLQAKIREYIRRGAVCLISEKIGNTSAVKITDEAGEWLIAHFASPVERMTVERLFVLYNSVAGQMKWKPLVSSRTIQMFLNRPDVKPKWYGMRYGELKAKEKYVRQHKTVLPTCRDALWYSDGTKLNLYYLDEKGRIATCQVYEVMDAYSEVFLGYHISKSENYEAQYNAFKMAIKFAGYRPYELKYDNQGGHKRLQTGNFLEKVARLSINTAPYNGKSKTIESAFGRFQSGFMSGWNFTGQNITTKRLESKANMEFILANKNNLPTLENAIKQYLQYRTEWNNARHPKSGIPRLQMYRDSVNPKARKIELWDMVDLFWVRSAKPVTYTNAGITIRVNNQKYTYEVFTEKGLPDTAFMLRNIDRKFYVYYDPDDLDNVKLFSVDKDSRFVADARPYIEVHRAKQDQDELDASFIKYQELEGKRQRVEMMQRTEDLMKKYGTHPEQNGLNMPPIKGLNMKNEKCKNRSVPVEIGGYEKEMSNLDELDLAEEYDKYINSKIDFDKYKDL